MPPYTQYTPFTLYENALSKFSGFATAPGFLAFSIQEERS